MVRLKRELIDVLSEVIRELLSSHYSIKISCASWVQPKLAKIVKPTKSQYFQLDYSGSQLP